MLTVSFRCTRRDKKGGVIPAAKLCHIIETQFYFFKLSFFLIECMHAHACGYVQLCMYTRRPKVDSVTPYHRDKDTKPEACWFS